MILTFYSYKGGVGRSMALANIARWFQSQGLKVVMIDWDLEAPGLESFFSNDPAERETLRSKLGVLDLLVTYKDIFPSLPRPAGRELAPGSDTERAPSGLAAEQFSEILEDVLPPLAHMLVPIRRSQGEIEGSGSLWLLPAGCRNESRFSRYAETVQRFDWAEFYAKYEGEAYFEWMRRQLQRPETADVVLIDSRTGVAEMSGVSTRQLADVIVIFCAPNDQNLEGVAMMARSFTRPDLLRARGGRPIELVMVPARVDVSEGRPIDLFEERFRTRLESYLPALFRQLGRSFDKLRIPYISAYAYAERLAIGDPEGVKGLQDAYVTLATHLAVLSPADSQIKRQCRKALQAVFGLPIVFITYLDELGAEYVSNLRERLETAGVLTLPVAQEKPEAALDRAIQSRGSPGTSAAVVLAVSGASLREDRLRDLWRRAREQGVCLYLVATDVSTPVDEGLPRWLRKARLFEASRDWNELVHLLQSPCQAPRVPFLAPPPPANFIDRTEEIQRIKDLLFGAQGKGGAPVVLVGMGGIGKTALAKIVCNDDDVVDFFEDGILWITLGARPDLRLALSKLATSFEGDAAAKLDLDEAERRLTEHLAAKRCLLVLDDVYEPGQLERIPRGGPGCQLLMTTRARDVATKVNAAALEIGGLRPADAQRALIADLDAELLDPAMVARVAQQMDGSPLALALANQTVRTRMQQGENGARALASLGRNLEEEGLTAVDPGTSQDTATSISAAFTLAIERLEPADRARLPVLASLPANRPLDAQEVAGVMSMTLADTEQLLRRLAAQSLLDFDANVRSVRLPALTHAFVKSLEMRQRRAEATRMATAVPSAFRVFLSYRREDSAGYAGRIYDRLTQHFGFDRILMDIDTISPGQDFVEAIRDKIASANALIVLIGPRWLDTADADGVRRLETAHDFVRLEIATAMARGLRVIPVLIGGARMPTPQELPTDLAGLARRQALDISDSRFNQDTDSLIQALEFLTRDAKVVSATGRREAEQGDVESLHTTAAEESYAARESRTAPRSRSGRRLLVAFALSVALVSSLIAYRWISAPFQTESGTSPASGSAEGLFAKAEDYYFGRGVVQDYLQAAKLYRQAADLGYPPAQNALGRMYENGLGVSRQEADAVMWYRKAAEQGHPDAQAALKRLNSGSKAAK